MKGRKISLEYLGGLFDGEGYVGFTCHNRPRSKGRTAAYFRPVVTIAQGHRGILDLIRAQIKLGYIGGKDGYAWRVSGRMPVLKFLRLIRKHVIIKSAQVELMIITLEKNLPSTLLHHVYWELRRMKKEREI